MIQATWTINLMLHFNYQHLGTFQYPTLASLSSKERTSPEETQTLRDKVSKGLEKYLHDAE